jgi:ABC-type cobalamin/Fe3+-siderophores transport system ATPase subunit
MNYEGILGFKGTWRNYQARVLEHADRYMADGKIHIVAAPGSGKTTLGIELIRRMNGKALILAPSITIREQWIARIEEAFLCEGVQGEDFLSQNLKQPKAITVATYQALHSAMTRFQGMQEDAGEESGTGTDECLTENETEEVDDSSVFIKFFVFSPTNTASTAETIRKILLTCATKMRSIFAAPIYIFSKTKD